MTKIFWLLTCIRLQAYSGRAPTEAQQRAKTVHFGKAGCSWDYCRARLRSVNAWRDEAGEPSRTGAFLLLESVVTANTDPVFRPPSAVERIAQQLRAMALKMAEGDYIGSEQSLARQFFVSGPTLRQAIRLLEHEGLIKVRRGVRGGYYVGRIRVDTLTRAAATYLHGAIRSFDEITELLDYLLPFVIDNIIANKRLGEMKLYVEPFRDKTHKDFVQRQTEFMRLVMDLAENVPLQFVMTILYQIVSTLPLDGPSTPVEGNRALETVRAEVARALVAKDREAAIAAYRKGNRLVGGAIKQYLAGGVQPEV
jgi:DNA-binding FadR family transcriptional regulator